jgi:ElaB/YqjD/DUF883 family membrane-anchored ribosome-binding protein
MQANAEKLIRDMRLVLQDAEELIKATAGDIGEKTREARAKLAGALVVAKETCNQVEETTLSGVQATRTAIRGHPYESVGIAFGIGMAIGILLRRRDKHSGPIPMQGSDAESGIL